MPTVLSNGIHMHAEVRGEGTPLLLIPGLGLTADECRRFSGELAVSHRLITIDNRGAGESDKPEAPYTIPMMAEDASGALQALGLPKAHVLGISMGGKIAVALALAHPEQVSSLILVSTQAVPSTPSQHRRVGFLTFLSRAMGVSDEAYAGRERQREASQSFNAWERLGEIHPPTLIVHARKDSVASFALAEEMHQRIEGSAFVAVPGGHAFFFVRPRILTEAVLPILSILDKSGGGTAPDRPGADG